MALARPRTATYADLQAVPPHLVSEIIDGALVAHPRPAPKHGVASFALGVKLGEPFQHGNGRPGGWLFIDEPELHLDGHVVVPDIAGWRRGRLPELPDTALIETPPDWVCGIASPSTEAYDRGPKRRIYAEAGIAFLWIVDPRGQLLEAFALTGGKWLLTATFGADDEVSVAPFDAISFPLAALWPFDRPPAAEAENKS